MKRDKYIQLQESLTGILNRHIGSTCTAAVAWVEGPGDRRTIAAGGRMTLEIDTPTISEDTPFDLASLTKLFTATAVLRLVALGHVRIDERFQTYVPSFSGTHTESITVRHLLTHTSGLPAMLRLYGASAPNGDPWDAILRCGAVRPPGSRVEYSDVGFMLLGRLLEEVTASPLREAMDRLVLRPLGLGARYGPGIDAPATEYDAWRGRRIQGEVHDENAAVLGGAAGHAGLFGSAADVVSLARSYLHPDGSFLPAELAQAARSENARTGTERRGLGLALRSDSPDASEAPFSPSTFGHYGFTGTAVWADPERDIITVLLANRVYFGRGAERIKQLRSEVFEEVAMTVRPVA